MHKELKWIHRTGKKMDGLFSRKDLNKDDKFYCFLDVDVHRKPYGNAAALNVIYHYGVCLGKRLWMRPRTVIHKDPVFFINCSTTPNVVIDYHYIECPYARLAEVTILDDIVIKVKKHNMSILLT